MREICMVEIAFDFIYRFQRMTQLFTIFPRDTIYNSTLVFQSSSQQTHYIFFHVLFPLFVSHLINKIGSVERALEIDDVIGDAQSFGYVFFYLDSGCGSQTEEGHGRIILL